MQATHPRIQMGRITLSEVIKYVLDLVAVPYLSISIKLTISQELLMHLCEPQFTALHERLVNLNNAPYLRKRCSR
jgi:hypothetical protein